jgi:hypothetical protein
MNPPSRTDQSEQKCSSRWQNPVEQSAFVKHATHAPLRRSQNGNAPSSVQSEFVPHSTHTADAIAQIGRPEPEQSAAVVHPTVQACASNAQTWPVAH